MDYFHFSFDIKDINKDTINILSKTDSAIHNNLSVAMSFFPESWIPDEKTFCKKNDT